MSLIRRESAFGVSEKTARGLKFWILEVEELFNLCSKNKGADELRRLTPQLIWGFLLFFYSV